MNRNLAFTLAYNLPSEVELIVRRMYNQNDRKDFEHFLIDVGFPLQYGDVIPDDIDQTKKLNSLILQSMAEDYGSSYLKIENVGVSQNWTAVCKHLEPDETDMIVGVDPDEEPQEDGWIKACGDVLRADPKLAYVAPFLLDHHRNTFEKNPIISTKEIAGHEVYVTTGNTNFGIMCLSGAFLKVIGGIPIPKDMKIYGGMEVELLRQVILRGYYYGTMKAFTEAHTNNVPLYREWKNAIIFNLSRYGKQISFEKWLQMERQARATT